MPRLEDHTGRGKADGKPEVEKSRTSCCGLGAYAYRQPVYVVMDPTDKKPTQTSRQIGSFRACSRCAKPLGSVRFLPGESLPSSVWCAMQARVDTHGPHAYWAQREKDGKLTLFAWPKFLKTIEKAMDALDFPRGESIAAKRERALRGLHRAATIEHEVERRAAAPPEPVDADGDAQEPYDDEGELERADF